MEMNEILDKLPKHLLDIVIDQPYNTYTTQDHALWRYVMRQNVRYLSKVAHSSYLDGLKKTGVSIESIPHMYGMNRILKEIGWAAVAVDGFIPPAAFMEFQAYNVLVIAADIRPIDQIQYTPAPDIIHEAAGHAPIIANEEYAEYLRNFGIIGSKAFSSAIDYQLYEAIRHLSILKANPYTEKSKIEQAEKRLSDLEQNMGPASEMSLIRNLHWWTVEYGLIGDLDNPKIYGAGLLSSIGESYNCLQPSVKKLPYTLEAVNYNFDITNQQPQLFVTEDFENLNKVLDEFADTMALRRGGVYGLQKAIESENDATAVYSSGLQVSGVFTEFIEKDDELVYIKTNGPTTLNYNDKVLDGHGKDYHSHGFSSPVGKLKNISAPLETLSEGDLVAHGIKTAEIVNLEFESGVKVNGKLEKVLSKDGRNLIFSFSNCTVTYQNETLFQPEWGMFDMAVGERIVSAFSGPADPVAYGLKFYVPAEKTHKIVHSERATNLHNNYQKVRDIREGKQDFNEELLKTIFTEIKTDYTEDWLLSLEILEILVQKDMSLEFQNDIRSYLDKKSGEKESFKKLITDGLEAVSMA